MSLKISNPKLKQGFQDISKEIKNIRDLIDDEDFEFADKSKIQTRDFSSSYTDEDLDKIDQLRNFIRLLGGYPPIYVTSEFEIPNGVRGFSLPALLKLLVLIKRAPSFRAVIGMCAEHHELIHEKYFKTLRLQIGLPFSPLQPISSLISLNSHTTTAIFQKDSVYHSLVLNPKISNGIYKLTVKVDHIGGSFAFLGVASASSISPLKDHWVGGAQGGACYYSDPEYVVVYTKYTRTPFIDKTFQIKNGDVIAAEVDMTKHTVVFFHFDQLLPYYVVSIPEAVHFGYSGSRMGGVTISFVSLLTLGKPTVSAASADFRTTAVQWTA